MSGARKDLLQALIETMFSVMKHVDANHGFRLGELTLSRPHIRILFHVARSREEVAVKDLAEMLCVTPGAVTQLLDGLEEMGLVRREEDTRDRRIIRIKLTEFARGELEALRQSYLASASQMFGVLSDAEIKELLMLLEKVNTHSADVHSRWSLNKGERCLDFYTGKMESGRRK